MSNYRLRGFGDASGVAESVLPVIPQQPFSAKDLFYLPSKLLGIDPGTGFIPITYILVSAGAWGALAYLLFNGHGAKLRRMNPSARRNPAMQTYYDVIDSLGGVVSWPGSSLQEARSLAHKEAILNKRSMKIKNHTTGRLFETVSYRKPRAVRRRR